MISSDLTKSSEGDCLEKCLAELSVAERKLVISYYSKDKDEKNDVRKILAEKLKIQPNALYTRVYRIKLMLKECVEKCLGEK